MTTMLIANNCTRENGQFLGDQLCYLKVAHLFVQNQPDVDRVVMSLSPRNEMDFLWRKFLRDPRGDGRVPPVKVVYDDFDPGDNPARWRAWDQWRMERCIFDGEVPIRFDHYRELYLRIHGAQRQTVLCGMERGLTRRNIYEYVFYGQEHLPDTCAGADWYDDTLIDHPKREPRYDVYISPHAKTQGNLVFTFDFWSEVVHRLVDLGVTVTVGYDGRFCDDLRDHPCYRRHWGTHEQWMEEVCRHKLVACGNTGTGWLAAACGVPMITMEPHNSCMADHRYRECGLRNIVEVVDGYKLDELGNDMNKVAEYVARRIAEEVDRRVVLTTGCYDVLHAGHVRHLERAKAMGTRLVVALNSDASVRGLKGTVGGVQRPINPQHQRKAVLEALRCVDEVRVFDGPDATDLIRELRPDVLACGFGYAPDTIVGRDVVEGYGGRVAVTCTGDARDEPSTTKIVQRVVRSGDVVDVCRIAATVSVNPFEKLRLLADLYLSVKDVSGDIADLGAYRGGTSLILRRLAPDKHLHLFDTWEGNPYDDPLCHHKRGEWATRLEDCRTLVGSNHSRGDTHYHVGLFPETVEEANLGLFSFVYVDMDTERATRDAIAFFWPRLTRGGMMVFDDYGWEPCAGVKVAVDEGFGLGPDDTDPRRVVQPFTCVVTKR